MREFRTNRDLQMGLEHRTRGIIRIAKMARFSRTLKALREYRMQSMAVKL